MDIYKYYIETNNDIKKYISNNNICFLDIETTGLSREYSYVYLIGFVYFSIEDNSWCLEQAFINHIEDEYQLLDYINKFISNFDLLITYNGDSFDLPFIKKRSSINNINSKILDMQSFDIYREIRKNRSYLDFKNMRLKTIEENLGIYREDEYSGKDCIDFYYEYMNTRDLILKEKILKHNYDDLYYLLDVMKIFDLIKDKKSTIVSTDKENVKVEIQDITVDKDIFKIFSITSSMKDEINFVYHEESFSIIWQSENNLIINLEVQEGFITPTKKCIFINKNNLPSIISLKDLTQYMVPDSIILLKVEDKYQMKNIKAIINNLISYVLSK